MSPIPDRPVLDPFEHWKDYGRAAALALDSTRMIRRETADYREIDELLTFIAPALVEPYKSKWQTAPLEDQLIDLVPRLRTTKETVDRIKRGDHTTLDERERGADNLYAICEAYSRAAEER